MIIDKADVSKKINRNFVDRLSDLYLDTAVDRQRIIDEIYDSVSKNEYTPSNPEIIIDLDKGHGVARYIPIFKPIDYSVYFLCVLTIDEELASKRVDGTYGGYSMGGKIRKKEREEDELWADFASRAEYSFDPSAYFKHWGEFNDKIKTRITATSGDYYILEYDIANFYDHVRLDLLENLVRSATKPSDEAYVNLLFYFLNNWNKLVNSYRPQKVSLPQELVGDCSRILANFYLQEYDQKMRQFCDENNIMYLRYADDHVLFVPIDFNHKKIIRKASVELSKLGLNLNPKKIKLTKKLENYQNHKAYPIFDILDSRKKYPGDQTAETANLFAEALLSAERKKLVKKGAPLMKVLISMGVNKLNPVNRRGVLRLLYNEYIEILTERHLNKLRNVLTKSEQNTLYTKLNEVLKKSLHNNYKYEVYKFARQHSIKRFYWLKDAILDARDWTGA